MEITSVDQLKPEARDMIVKICVTAKLRELKRKSATKEEIERGNIEGK